MRTHTLLFFALCTAFCASAQLQPEVISIPMRDGKSLAADLYLPSDTGTYPVILIQTPYNKNLFRLGLPLNVGWDIASSPYAFVILDWRCFYGSTSACSVDATGGEDGYDAVEWIAAQPWSNGKVGTLGASALGNIQFSTAREHPPHLVCAVPTVASPQFRYQQYYPGGVCLHEYLETLSTLFGNAFSLVKQNQYYNVLWQITENTTYYPDEIAIPMLHIGGWFDHNTEDVLLWFRAMRQVSPAAEEQWILMGPWTHGGTGFTGVGTAQQGDLSFPGAAGAHNQYANQFFGYYLLGENNGWESTEHVIYFQTGDDVWNFSPTFPPPSADKVQTWYLGNDLTISPDASAETISHSYAYDPENPSPTIGGKTLSDEVEQGPFDQAEVEARNDNVIFSSAILTQDVSLEGQLQVVLYVSSDKTDTDFNLRLTDVYPDGRSIAFGQIAQRMRFRSGYTMNDEELMVPGEIYEITMTFDNLAHTFKAGHRIRLIVTSSNYVWFNRNMNTGGPMYPDNNLDTLVQPVVAMNTVHTGGNYPSRVLIPSSSSLSGSHEAVVRADAEFYPNPVHEELVVLHSEAGSIITITDVQGRQIWKGHGNEGETRITVRQIPSGVYFLRMMHAAKISTGRFVISAPKP